MGSLTANEMLEELEREGKAFRNGDLDARGKIMALCKDVTVELEQPGETFLRTFWAQPTQMVAIRTAIDMDVFRTLEENNGTPKSCKELAAPKNADVPLVARLVRHLAAMAIVKEVGVDQFVNTNFSRGLTEGPLVDGVKFIFDFYLKVHLAAPEFLKTKSWKNPVDARDIPYQYALDLPGTTMFEHFAQNPEIGMLFGGMLAAYAAGKPMWVDIGAYPVRERLGSAKSPEDTLVVDIGGGAGHDIAALKAKHPELQGKLVLQELPYMVERLQGNVPGVEVMVHDFNAVQPIKGARAYFMHNIMHDYIDSTCKHILEQIKPAMTPGYSKILINDLVLPAKDAHWLTTALDIELMMCLASRERTEKEFRDVIESAGLKVEGIWKHPQGYDSIIECVLP